MVGAGSTASELAVKYMEVVPRAIREYRKEMRKGRTHGLTVPQFRILAQLRLDPSNNRTLAEQQGVSVAAMSRMVDGLCRNGFVRRQSEASDRRQVRVVLTSIGRKRFDQFRDDARRRLQRRLMGLNAQEKRDLLLALRTLDQALDILSGNSEPRQALECD